MSISRQLPCHPSDEARPRRIPTDTDGEDKFSYDPEPSVLARSWIGPPALRDLKGLDAEQLPERLAYF
jgi:hypothetical protein